MTTEIVEKAYVDRKAVGEAFLARQDNQPEQITSPLSAVDTITA